MDTKFSIFTIDSILAKNERPNHSEFVSVDISYFMSSKLCFNLGDRETKAICNDGIPKVQTHPKEITIGRITVKLLEADLWEDFSKVGTEMIITKAGR